VTGAPALERLDFIYTPSRDVAAEAAPLAEQLGGELVFAIEAFGARVALIRLGDGGPDLLLADHLEGERPILVYRVADLDESMRELESRGLDPGPRFGVPHGPCCSFEMPGGHLFALYEATRPNATEHFAGRRDF
jgi:hypothetical protein